MKVMLSMVIWDFSRAWAVRMGPMVLVLRWWAKVVKGLEVTRDEPGNIDMVMKGKMAHISVARLWLPISAGLAYIDLRSSYIGVLHYSGIDNHVIYLVRLLLELEREGLAW